MSWSYIAPMCVALLWVYFRHTTTIEPPTGDDVRTYGSVEVHAVRRIGLIVGSVHQQGCLEDGISQATEDTASALNPLVAALRQKGMDVTIAHLAPWVLQSMISTKWVSAVTASDTSYAGRFIARYGARADGE